MQATLLDALAHEFKTLLTAIKAAATTLLSQHGLGEVERDLVMLIDGMTDELNVLVNEAIDLRRRGSGKIILHPGSTAGTGDGIDDSARNHRSA